jgi:ribosomal protein S7
MRRGKKLKAYNVFMNFLSMLKIKLKLLKITLRRFMQIIALNSFPLLSFITRSVGSRKYKIPIPIAWKKSAHLTAL